MAWPIDMEQKGCESIECWTQVVTFKVHLTSGRQNQRPIVPDEWHNHTGRVAVTVDLSDGRVAIIEQNTKQSNYLKLRISHTPDTISESWKLLWREQVISHM